MKIRAMTATFGKLNNARLEPGEGLNLIYAPNEGGKSTWCAFWRAMLYGIDTRDRDRKGYLADKNRYQPWSGAPMMGEVTLHWQGRDITIRRGPRGSVPFGAFSAVYAGTEEPVPGLTAANCGQLLTGVGPEVFSRSAFLGGGALALTTAPELERRIAALVTSGEEGASYSQVQDRLREWRNKRQVNRSVGEIPRLEGELSQTREVLEQVDQAAGLLRELEAQRVQLEDRRADLAAQEEAHRALARRQLAARYAQAEEAYHSAQSALEALEAESRAHPIPSREALRRAQGELQYLKVLDEEIQSGRQALKQAEEAYVQAQIAAQDERFAGLSGEEAAEAVRKTLASHAASLDTARSKRACAKLLPLFGAACLLVVGAVCLVREGTLLSPLLSAGGAAAITGLLAGAVNWISARSWSERAEKLLSRYGVHTPEELEQALAGYRARGEAAGQAAQEVQRIRGTISDRQARRENSWTDIMEFVHSFAPEAQTEFGCSAALSRALNLEHDLAAARDLAQERRQRLEDLGAQGGGREEAPLSAPAAPVLSREETGRELAAVQDRLEQVNAQLNQARGRLRAMGDPAALSARKEELEGALERRTLEYEALTLAMDTMTQANARLQERFSPELNRLAGQYLARLTGERYQAVSLTRELEGSVQGEGDVLPRSALFLSRGTADQLYLAVRLAVCRLCLPQKPPIVLDDALAAFDEGRLARALTLLRELAQEQQLLLFSCHSRERDLLAGAEGVTLLSL